MTRVPATLSWRARHVCDSFERLLTHKDGFGLTTASPMQRAVMRIMGGEPLGELAELPELERALECSPALLPTVAPREFNWLSGVRVGKSLLTAAIALGWSQRCDLSICGPGDYPRVSIVSIAKDQADVVFGHLLGRMRASNVLSSLIIGEPAGDSLWVTHPTGSRVEIRVVAGSRAGGSLTARWMAGVVFDEWPRMHGDGEHVVNWAESRKAVDQRILPGGGIANIGSPHAPFGPAFDAYTASMGKPSAELVMIRSPAYDMNPFWWTPERVEAARANPDTFETEVEGRFATPEEVFLPSTWLERSRRTTPTDIAPQWGADYAAGMDPATRGNGWTLVVATRTGEKRVICLAKQWVGSRSDPLSAREVFAEIATVLKPYGLTSVYTDRYGVDFLRDTAAEFGLALVPTYWTQTQMTERWTAFRERLGAGLVELHPDPVLRADLQRLSKRVTQAGVQIHLPKTGDGRHCDYAPSVLLALSKYLDDVEQPAPEPNTKAAYDAEHRRMVAESERQHRGGRGLWD